jgi:hypothetical protein
MLPQSHATTESVEFKGFPTYACILEVAALALSLSVATALGRHRLGSTTGIRRAPPTIDVPECVPFIGTLNIVGK